MFIIPIIMIVIVIAIALSFNNKSNVKKEEDNKTKIMSVLLDEWDKKDK